MTKFGKELDKICKEIMVLAGSYEMSDKQILNAIRCKLGLLTEEEAMMREVTEYECWFCNKWFPKQEIQGKTIFQKLLCKACTEETGANILPVTDEEWSRYEP